MSLEAWKLLFSIIGYLGAVIAFVVGFLQYRRADYWKRSEFLAGDMKTWFADPNVSAAMTMIDWGLRDVRLLDPTAGNPKGLVSVNRALQCSALRPHSLPRTSDQTPGTPQAPSSDEVVSSDKATSGGAGFSDEEAAIRDAYDRFLDGLDRFGNYLTGELVSTEDLQPYLEYWIDDIADTRCNAEDADWTVCLLAYIEFYAFIGVQSLFDGFGHNIRLDGDIVNTLVEKSADQARLRILLTHVKSERPSPPRPSTRARTGLSPCPSPKGRGGRSE